MPKKPKPKARPSEKISPAFGAASPTIASIAKLSDKKLIAILRTKFFGPLKRHLKDYKPYLWVAHKRFAQPGRRIPIPGRPLWGEFVRKILGVHIRTVQLVLAEDKPKQPTKKLRDKYDSADIRHLEMVALAAQKLADSDPDNEDYEPIRKAIREKPSGFGFVRGDEEYYEGNKVDGKHYLLTPKEMWKNLQKRWPGIWDCCPYPRKKGYDALQVPWHPITYCNPPFVTANEGGKKIGFTAWCRKAIAEQARGVTTVMVSPIDLGLHVLLDAGATFTSIGDVKWRATEDGSAQASGRKIVEIVLPGKKKVEQQHYRVSPPELLERIRKQYGEFYDPAPNPKPADYNGLTDEWGEVNYVNPPWFAKETWTPDGRRKGITAWVRKAIEEQAKGKTSIIIYPMHNWVGLLADAGAEMVNFGPVKFCSMEEGDQQGKPMGTPIIGFVLRGKK